MRATATGWREALSGLISVDTQCAVWLGSEVTVSDLVIQSGSVTQELAGDQVQTTVALEVADPTGELFTGWSGSPLDVLGHRARITTTVSAGGWSETLPVGTMRINSIQPQNRAPWRLYAKTGQWVRGGQTLSLSCGDLLDQVADEEFLAPSPPQSWTTVGVEVQRLTAGIVPVGSSVSTLTAAVPASMSYDDTDRLGTVVDLMRAADCVPMVDRNGVLQAISASGSGSEWLVPMDAVISATPSADRSDLHNGWVVTSETESGEPLRGQSLDAGGPTWRVARPCGSFARVPADAGVLRWGGPFGRVPRRSHLPVLTTNAACAAAARTMQDKDAVSRRRTLTVVCGTDPAVDVLDTAVIELPTGPVSGLITRISRPLHQRWMTLDMSVDWEALRG